MYYAFVVQYCFPKMCEGRSGACWEPQVGIRLDLICLRLSFSARNAGFHSLLLGASPQINMMIPNSTLHGDRLMKCPVCNSDVQCQRDPEWRSISAPPAEAYGLIAGSLTRLLNGRAATRNVDNCQQTENGTLARPMIRRRSTRRIRRNGNRSGAICSILAELSGCPVTCDRSGGSFGRTMVQTSDTTSRHGTKIASATFSGDC